MPLDLSGKYWRIAELEEKLCATRAQIFPVIKGREGVIKISGTYLVPQSLIPVLDEVFKNTDSLTLSSTAYKVRAGVQVIKKVLQLGFPHERADGDFLIKKSNIPALKNAIDEVRERDGKVSVLKSNEITEKALKYLADQND